MWKRGKENYLSASKQGKDKGKTLIPVHFAQNSVLSMPFESVFLMLHALLTLKELPLSIPRDSK